MNKYEWKMRSLAKGIDPELALTELERIEAVYGSLTAENVLEASRDEGAVLHSLFQWDDTKAAHQYRLQQARSIINNIEVRIISDGYEKRIPVYEVVNIGDGRAYKSISVMDTNDIEYVKERTKTEINYLRNKLIAYKELDKTVNYLDKAIGTLE